MDMQEIMCFSIRIQIEDMDQNKRSEFSRNAGNLLPGFLFCVFSMKRK